MSDNRILPPYSTVPGPPHYAGGTGGGLLGNPTAETFWIYTVGGQPKDDADPEWVFFIDLGGATLPEPEFLNLGDGQYRFNTNDFRRLRQAVGLIDCGAGCLSRYQYVAVFSLDSAFALYVPFDSLGALSSGAPTVGSYRALEDGSVLTPPPVLQVGARQMYTVTPSAEDLERGVGYRLDSPDPVTFPLFMNGVFFNPA